MLSLDTSRIRKLCLLQLIGWLISALSFADRCNANNFSSPLSLPKVSSLRGILDKPCTVAFEETPALAAIQELAASYHFHYWWDRRLDSGLAIDFQAGQNASLEQVLSAVAKLAGAETTWLEDVIYFGPIDQIANIDFAYWKLHQQFPTKAREVKQDWAWKAKAEPKQLLQDLAASQGLTIENLEKVEYDLWRAEDYGQCTVPARWSMLLAGFGLTAELDIAKRTMRIKEMSDAKPVAAKYPASKINKKVRNDWLAKWPGSRLEGGGTEEWKVLGTPLAQRDLLFPARTKKVAKADLSKARFSGSLQGRLVDVLTGICDTYALSYAPNPMPKEWQDKIVNVTVKDLTLNQLLSKIGDSIQLKLELELTTIRLGP